MKTLGTADALKFVTFSIYNNLDINKPTIRTLRNISKIFDTIINQKFLCEKLDNYEIRGIY